ncbi:hypothetical protein ACHAXS_009026 [Conticribra weissflogii]
MISAAAAPSFFLDSSAFVVKNPSSHLKQQNSHIHQFLNPQFPLLAKCTSNNDDVTLRPDIFGPGTDKTSPSNAKLRFLQIAQSHFVAQALHAIVRLHIPDVLAISADEAMSIDNIITMTFEKDRQTSIDKQALFRCLRLLCTAGIIEEVVVTEDGRKESAFFLTETGQLLQTEFEGMASPTDRMSSFVLHWMEQPLWDAWSHLPDYLAGSPNAYDGKLSPPFDRANRMPASEFYRKHDYSRIHRNSVAKYASSKEIDSILDAIIGQRDTIGQEDDLLTPFPLNAAFLEGKTVVDIGGGYGDFMMALKGSVPSIKHCYCLDLPEVIADAVSTRCDSTDSNTGEQIDVSFVPGDMFEPSTIPTPCDIIFTKHVLCDFSDEDVVRALQSFHEVLKHSDPKHGRVVIMDAVLPNGDELNGKWNSAVSFDVLLMLTGRRGERSCLEWSNLAEKAGFSCDGVMPTTSVTVDLAVLSINQNSLE